MRKRNNLFVGIYCNPTTAKRDFPNRINEECYTLLKKGGVNAIFGNWELYDDPSLLKDEIALAEKVGIAFYPRLPIFQNFWTMENCKSNRDLKPFSSLSDEEKEKLGTQFVKEVKECFKSPAVPGIFFSDEVGINGQKGIAYAKSLFDKNFPNKEFRLNTLNYLFNDAMLYYANGGSINVDPQYIPALTGNLADGDPNNHLSRYEYLWSETRKLYHQEICSCDGYPYLSYWKELPSSIHKMLFELNAYYAEKRPEWGYDEYDHYIQTGTWDSPLRPLSEGEFALQISITLAYGHEGIVFFPGVFPPEWLDEFPSCIGGQVALIDMMGRPTIYYHYAKNYLEFLQPLYTNYLSKLDFKGVYGYGKFKMDYDAESIKDLKDNDAIFAGEIPNMVIYEPNGIEKIDTSSQLLISTFLDENGKEKYLFTNTSTQNKAIANITFKNGMDVIYGEDGQRKLLGVKEVSFSLRPGKLIYIG